MAGRRYALLTACMKGATRLGNGVAWAVLAAAFLFLRNGMTTFRQLVLAFALELTAYKVLKMRVSRVRPFVALPAVAMLIALPDEFSFPSGHTAAAFLVATVVGFSCAALFFPLLALAMLIGISRVYLGVHYPTDVVAGAVLGSVAGSLGILLA